MTLGCAAMTGSRWLAVAASGFICMICAAALTIPNLLKMSWRILERRSLNEPNPPTDKNFGALFSGSGCKDGMGHDAPTGW
jgi:hypothetical protein